MTDDHRAEVRSLVSRRTFIASSAVAVAVGGVLRPAEAPANPFAWIWRMLITLFRGGGAARVASRSIVRAQAARNVGVGAALMEAANGFMTIHDVATLAGLSDSLIGVRPEVHASIQEHQSQAVWFRGEHNAYELQYSNDSGVTIQHQQLSFEIEDLETEEMLEVPGPLMVRLDQGAQGVIPLAPRYLRFPVLSSTGPKTIRPFFPGHPRVIFDEIGPVQVVNRSDVQLAPGWGP